MLNKLLDPLFDKLPYEKLENVRPAYFMAGGAGVGALLMVVYFFTLYSMGQADYAELSSKKAAAEDKLKADENLVRQAGMIAGELAVFVQHLSDAKQQMPGSNEMPQLLRKVSAIEKDLSVQVISLKVAEGQLKDYYKEIPISIQIRGGFWNVVGFFDRFQYLLQAVAFSELKVELASEKEKAEAAARSRGRFAEPEPPPQIPKAKKEKIKFMTTLDSAEGSMGKFESEPEDLLVNVTAKIFAYIEGSENAEFKQKAPADAGAPPPADAAAPPPPNK